MRAGDRDRAASETLDVLVVVDHAPGLPKQLDQAGFTKRCRPLLQPWRVRTRAGRDTDDTPRTVHAIQSRREHRHPHRSRSTAESCGFTGSARKPPGPARRPLRNRGTGDGHEDSDLGVGCCTSSRRHHRTDCLRRRTQLRPTAASRGVRWPRLRTPPRWAALTKCSGRPARLLRPAGPDFAGDFDGYEVRYVSEIRGIALDRPVALRGVRGWPSSSRSPYGPDEPASLGHVRSPRFLASSSTSSVGRRSGR